MTRFLVWSDLHAEFWGRIPDIAPRDDIDALLIAGDTHTRGRHVDMALLAWDRLRVPVVMVRGNHEFYGSRLSDILKDDRRRTAKLRSLGAEVHILEGTAVEISGTRIVGGTLWTDFNLFPGQQRGAREVVEESMNDFVEIRIDPIRTLSSADMIEMHLREKERMWNILSQPFEGPTVVMSHHVPTIEMVPGHRLVGSDRKKLSVCGFASDLWPEIRNLEVDVWVSGHSHDPVDLTLEGERRATRFVSNPRGYPKEELPFDPDFTVEVMRGPGKALQMNLEPEE